MFFLSSTPADFLKHQSLFEQVYHGGEALQTWDDNYMQNTSYEACLIDPSLATQQLRLLTAKKLSVPGCAFYPKALHARRASIVWLPLLHGTHLYAIWLSILLVELKLTLLPGNYHRPPHFIFP